jgi:hypothetical protein
MDHEFVALARDNGLFYTRYVDDITFSTNRTTFPLGIAETHDGNLTRVGSAISEILDKSGFALNDRKARIRSRSSRQEVTGLTVNSRINLPRRYYRQVRSMLHAWMKWGHDGAEAEYHARFDTYGRHAEFRKVVAGKLAYLRQVRGPDDRAFRRIYDWARGLDPDFFHELPPIAVQTRSLYEAARDFPSITRSDSVALRREYLTRMYASAEGTLWLVDPNLRIEPVKDLEAAVDPDRLDEIRILSRDRPPGGQADEFVQIKNRLLAKGIRCEWRNIGGNAFHDRWLTDDRTCIILGGPFGNLYNPSPPFGQNRVVPRPEQFDAWWGQANRFHAI